MKRRVQGTCRTILVVLATVVMCNASQSLAVRAALNQDLGAREAGLWRSAAYRARFESVQGRTENCEVNEPPQALATPNPVIESAETTRPTTVSFIVGADGRVYSPLILDSADPAEDRTILNAVRFWRYRPGTCNGAAIDSEAEVEFFSH